MGARVKCEPQRERFGGARPARCQFLSQCGFEREAGRQRRGWQRPLFLAKVFPFGLPCGMFGPEPWLAPFGKIELRQFYCVTLGPRMNGNPKFGEAPFCARRE